MLQCVPYTELMQEAWDALALTRGSIFHTRAFNRILTESFGYQPASFALQDGDGRLRALLPLITGRNLSLKKAGVALPFANYTDICADDSEAAAAALHFLPEIKDRLALDYLEIRLKSTAMTEGGWTGQAGNVTFLLPLSGGEEAVLALSTASNRNHVRKTYKNQWFEASFDPGHLPAFYRVYVKRMKELGSPAPSLAFFQRFFTYLPEYARLLTVLDRGSGTVIGGMLLLLSPGDRTLYYPYGAGLVAYNHKYLNNFMYWEAIKFGIGQQMEQMDLGRSPQGSGTYTYKAQWGAKPVPLAYWSLGREAAGTPEREKFGVFIELWKRLPSIVTDNLGPILIKYVMP